MVNKKQIISLIKTYELPERIENKLIEVSFRMIDELNINSFKEQYDLIARLVERFVSKFIDKSDVRLDALVSDNSDTTFYSFFSVEDPSLHSLLEGDSSDSITLSDALNILKKELSETDYLLFSQLANSIQNPNAIFHLSPEKLVTLAPRIGERLGYLARRYERDGGIVVPQRPIVYIRFYPLKIKFRNRKYNKNPLAFFRKHLDVYGGMSRSELYQFDQGLYSALSLHNQIHIAIPESKSKFSHQKIEEIIRAHEKYDGNAAEASKHMGCDTSTILHYWKESQLPIREQGGQPLCEGEIGRIIQAYGIYDGNATEAAEYLPSNRDKILNCWREAGLEIRKPGGQSLSQAKINKIVEAYDLYGGNAKEASKHLPHGIRQIRKYWKQNKPEYGR